MEIVNLLDVIIGNRELPDHTTNWGIRTVLPDLRSRYDYRWPYPGNWAHAPGPINLDNFKACPSEVGDGVCIATNWAGMASAGMPAATLLLVAYHADDQLGVDANTNKIRVAKAFVVDIIDGNATIRRHGAKADLRGADLRRAVLDYADLRQAVLSDAYLGRAALCNANLINADLRSAYLDHAVLSNANLSNADLSNADLSNADLRNANLSNADLRNANLSNANLRNADLRNAYLRNADLRNADLRNAILHNTILMGDTNNGR